MRLAARVVPRSTCLVQALAAERLLGRVGYVSELRYGVARSASGALVAHAWVEHDGRVVLGAGQEGFVPLTGPARDATA